MEKESEEELSYSLLIVFVMKYYKIICTSEKNALASIRTEITSLFFSQFSSSYQ